MSIDLRPCDIRVGKSVISLCNEAVDCFVVALRVE